jgi:hypothetical protein
MESGTAREVMGEATKPVVRHATSTMTAADWWDHLLARWSIDRQGHRVEPGLYALGTPDRAAPVFVTANYTLSFDALRTAVGDIDCYIVVLDTLGVNVWCAAGKGTFGTDELVRRVEATGLADVVDHRRLIVPQLGATGVAAHEVTRRTGFRVEYGPVRAADIPEYLELGEATAAMRRMTFPLKDRLVLIPVDLVKALPFGLGAAILLYFLGGPLLAWAALTAVLAGAVLFPILLPWLPTPNFSTKGLILGVVAAVPFLVGWLGGRQELGPWFLYGGALALLLTMPPVTAYIALNFTGSTTYTSKTGVEREIRRYIPAMVWTFGAGLVLAIVLAVAAKVGGR